MFLHIPFLGYVKYIFDEVYNYLMMRLQEANMKKDKEIMEEVLKHLRTMRDTWKQVMKLAHTQQ